MAQRAKSLEEYLSESYNKDIEDIRAIESTLVPWAERVLKVLGSSALGRKAYRHLAARGPQ
jgi:hypothetical protein